MSIQTKYSFLEEAYPDMLKGIGLLIQKGKLSNKFKSIHLSNEETAQLEKAKELCELKIIELWGERKTERFKALCATYFDLACELDLDITSEYYIYEQIKLISFGYLGEHWHFVRQYLKGNQKQIDSLEISNSWNKRLLFKCFNAIVQLVVKENWKDIDKAVQFINQLRDEQNDYEQNYLNQVNEESRPYGAAELISLYHFSKSIDTLGSYLIEGSPGNPEQKLCYNLNYSREFAEKSGNISLVLLFQFFEAFAIKMMHNTIWYTTNGVNHWVSKFNKFITKKDDKGIFELLYPQQNSITKGGLLNPAHKAIVVNLPTSSGKTMIAKYRILQALNEFKQRGGWVAYIAPTKSLVNQVFVELNRDLGSLGIKVEKASGAIELDGFEQYLAENKGNETDFDVLVTTYEKLNLLVRQGLGTSKERPMVLTIVDEAHNIEDQSRGLNLEFLLSTIKNDCEEANFLLMTPDISNSNDVVGWLAGERGKEINLQLDWWQPNERVVGAIEVKGRGRSYDFNLRTLHTLKGSYSVGEPINLFHFEDAEQTKSEFYGANGSKKKVATKTATKFLNIEEPIIVLASSPNQTYDIAEELYKNSKTDFEEDADVSLLKRLVASELGNDFPLVKLLDRRIAVHSSALPDEIKFLIEDLMSKGNKLQALVATTTIAQGINFPVSAIILGAYNYPFRGAMPVRDFWNLAGRVGRTGQDQMGWVGIALKNDKDLHTVTEYVKKASEDLLSQLVGAIDIAIDNKHENFDRWLYLDERWSAILQYISHLRLQIEEQEQFLAELEQKLQGTFGYDQLPSEKQTFLRDKIRGYARGLTKANAKISDQTGFSTVSVQQMIGRLSHSGMGPEDWKSKQLFSKENQSMQKLVGIMLNTYEIRRSISELSTGNTITDQRSISRLIIDWVNGKNISEIATRMFPNENEAQKGIQKTTKALYKVVANAATWGLSALQQMPTSGSDWENLSAIDKKRMANLPAYLHYGVNTDEGVLMRKNNVPRSIANSLGKVFKGSIEGDIFDQKSSGITSWIKEQEIATWNEIKPTDSQLSGEDYKKIWKKLNGIK